MNTLKDKIRNILIVLFFLTGIPFLRFLLLKKKYKSLVRVIVFHQIRDEQTKDFERKISFLKNNFNIISPQDFLNKNFSEDKLNILLTFDDAFKDWFKNVVPVLKKEKISAIFFLDKRGFNFAKKLSEMGFEIGSHTINHLRLPGLSLEKLREELKESKEILEKEIGKEIKFFAYPFGDKDSFNRVVKEEVEKAGYKYAFTILPGFNTKGTDFYCLHRDGLNVSWSNFFFCVWLLGSYDILKKVLNWLY